MPRQFLYFLLVVLSGCSSKKDQVESSESQTQPEQYTGNAVNGKVLFTTCATCHGDAAQGNQKMNAPALANSDDWYLIHQLKNFKHGVRGYSENDTLGFQMAAMAKTLKDTVAIADVVAYIKTFPAVTLTTSVTGDIKKGERAYQSICGSCHGQGGKGNRMMNAPRLHGIDDWYLKRQIRNFKNNIRGAHPDDNLGAQMVPMAALLTDENSVDNIIAYINSTVQPASK